MPVLDTTFLNAVTREKFIPVLKNNLYEGMPLFNRLFAKGRVKTMTGRGLLWDVIGKKHGSTGVYQGYDVLANQPTNPVVQASLSPANYYAALAISGDEERQNSGSIERLLDMVKVQIDNAKMTMKDMISTAVYGTGTAIGGRTVIQGLQAVITGATGTYAGINRATAGNEFWRSNVNSTQHAFANVTDPTDAKYLPSIMRTAYLNASHDKAPDLILTTKGVYGLYMNIAAANVLRINEQIASFGFGGAEFQAGVPMVFDTYITSGLYESGYDPIFFLTLDDMSVWSYEGANFDLEREGWRVPTNQDAKVAHILWSGQLRCDAPWQQAVVQKVALS
jgi:hypothetical protein